MAAWMLGSVLVVSWLIRQAVQISRIVRSGRRIEQGPIERDFRFLAQRIGLRRVPPLYQSDAAAVPFSCGLIAPRVVVPSALLQTLSQEQLRTVLAHELAHHYRRDMWGNGFQGLAFTMWWFHPVFWLLSRTMRRVREDCCDDLLLANGLSSPHECCSTLLAVARHQADRRSLQWAVTMAAPHSLATRFLRLMDDSQTRRVGLSRRSAACLAMLAVLFLPGLPSATSAPEKPEKIVETPTGGLLEGTVSDAEGRPIADARLLVTTEQPSPDRPADETIAIARGETDSDGRFRMDIDKHRMGDPLEQTCSIWICSEGHTMGFASFERGKPVPSIEVTLKRPSAEFTVQDPDHQPVADALVCPTYVEIDGRFAKVPSDVQDLVARRAELSGRVRLPVARREDIRSLRITAAKYGVQHFTFVNRSSTRSQPPEVLTLGPVGTLTGELVSDEPRAAAHIDVEIMMGETGESEHEAYRRMGVANTRTDANGHWEVPTVMAGTLKLAVDENRSYALRAVEPKGMLLDADRTLHVAVPLRKCVRVSGRVLDHVTKQTVAGVRILARQGDDYQVATTAADGSYTLNQLAGSAQLSFTPPEFYVQIPPFRPITIPRGDEHTLPDLLVKPGSTRRGRVVGPDDRPVAGVTVRAVWEDERSESSAWNSNFTGMQASAQSDADGRFTIERIDLDAFVRVSAMQGGVQVAEPVPLPSEQDAPLLVRVRRLELVTLAGLVVDAGGQPVGGIRFRIRNQCEDAPQLTSVCVVDEGVTDDKGRIRSTKQFDRFGEYQVELIEDDKVVATSDWLNPAKAGTAIFQPVIYRGQQAAKPVADEAEESRPPDRQEPSDEPEPQKLQTATLTGLLVDRDGKAVADARVIVWSLGHRLQTRSTDAGRFSLSDIPREGAFLFVESTGFRFHGQWAQPNELPIRIALTRRDEPAAPMRTLPDPPLPEELQQRAWQRFQPIAVALLEQYREGKGKRTNISEFDDREVLKLMARYEPQRTLEYVRTNNFANAGYPDHIRSHVVSHLKERDVETALSVVEQISSTEGRIFALHDLVPHLPLERKRRVLDQAWMQAKMIEDPSMRLTTMTLLIESYRELGDDEQVRDVLRDAEALVPRLGNDGRAEFARGMLAYQKARTEGIDTSALLGTIERDFSHNRYHGNIAHALAARDPAAAERIVQQMRGYSEWIPRVCHDMATVDVQRARRIAEAIEDPVHRAYAIGLIASAIAEQDKDQAVELIATAYALLVDTVEADSRTSLSVNTPVSTAVGMLPIVERIDPTLVREYLWRSLSLRKGSTFGGMSMALGPHGDGDRMRLADPVLAACLSRYDLELARRILRPPGDESTEEGVQRYPYYYFYSAAILDPEGTLETVAALPDDSRTQHVAMHQAWKELFASFSNRGMDRWNSLMEHQMHLWVIGKGIR